MESAKMKSYKSIGTRKISKLMLGSIVQINGSACMEYLPIKNLYWMESMPLYA